MGEFSSDFLRFGKILSKQYVYVYREPGNIEKRNILKACGPGNSENRHTCTYTSADMKSTYLHACTSAHLNMDTHMHLQAKYQQDKNSQ